MNLKKYNNEQILALVEQLPHKEEIREEFFSRRDQINKTSPLMSAVAGLLIGLVCLGILTNFTTLAQVIYPSLSISGAILCLFGGVLILLGSVLSVFVNCYRIYEKNNINKKVVLHLVKNEESTETQLAA